MDRRTLLARLFKTTGAMIAGIVTVPVAINAFSPLFERRAGEVWQPVGPIDEFPVGEVSPSAVQVPRPRDEARSLSEKGVFVWRPDDAEIIVFSRKCSDLSCTVIWDSGSDWFFCPCHGGIFSRDGERQAGPPQRPLYRFANRVEDGMLEVDVNSVPPNI